jgi:ComF family protein
VHPLLQRIANAALDLVAPRLCAGCDAPLCGEDLFCAVCCGTFDGSVVAESIDGEVPVVASGIYGGALARAIRRLKYEGRADLAAPLGRRLVRDVRALSSQRALLVPVPLHVRKLSERGFNQSALIAGALASELGWQVRARALRRSRDTSQQAKLGRSERLENLKGAVVLGRERLEGTRVVLVDDVVTTGATARSCVEALQQAGATVLAVAAIARAAEPKPRSEAEFLPTLQPDPLH